MKYILHWDREKNWKERCLLVDAPERSVEQSNDLDAALKNPLKFRMSHLREMEGNRKNLSPEQRGDFRDMAGYFLSLKQSNGSKKLPPQMLVQIEKSSLFSLLSQKMKEQIKNVLDRQMEELIDFSQKSIETPSTAIRATILYRRLRSRAHNDDRLKSIFDAVQSKLLGWAIEKLRKGSISSQVQKTLTGLKTTGEDGEKLTKQNKLIVAEIYRMFPHGEDWVDNCDAQSARSFALEAIQAVKEDPSDPTMVLSWNMIDEWMAEGNEEMISLLTQKFTPEELSQFIGRARAVELLQFAQKQAPFLPAHLQALNALKNEPELLPENYSEAVWQELSPAAQRIKEINDKEKLLKEKYDVSREEEVEHHKKRYPNGKEVLAYEKAVQKKETVITTCWDENVSQLEELIKRWDNIAKFEVQAAEARRKVLKKKSKLDIVSPEKDLERKTKYQEDQDKYIENYKKQLQESLLLFKTLQQEVQESSSLDTKGKEKIIQKFQKHIREKLPYSTDYGVSAQPEEDATLLQNVIEGLKTYEDEVKKQEEQKESAIKEMPFSKSFQEKTKEYDNEIKKLETKRTKFSKDLQAQEEWHEVFSNPQEHAQKAMDNFWRGIQSRLDNHTLHAADFEVLWNDEFEAEVAENITNLPEFEKIQQFRTAFSSALDGIFDDIDLTDDKYETWYEALDKKLSYENLIKRVFEKGFDIQKEFSSPQKISELLEGAITKYREEIFGMVKGNVAEDKQDEVYSHWDRLHGRLSGPVVDPSVIAGEHSKYEIEKVSADKRIQSEQEKNISIVEGLRQRASFLAETNPELKNHLEKEAQKLEEAWEVRKKWYSEGGRMSIENSSGETENVWAPGKKVLAEMALQAGGVEKEIGSLLEESITGPVAGIKNECLEYAKLESPVEKKKKQKVIREKLEKFFETWPQQKTKLDRLLGDHQSVLVRLIPEEEQLGGEFVSKIGEEGKDWIKKIDERIHTWKGDAKSHNYLYHGDEELFRMIPGAAQSLRSVIDFNQGKYSQESDRLDNFLEKDTDTIKFLDEEKFFSDSSVDRKEFKSKYEEMAGSFRSNIQNYKTQFKKLKSRLRKDLDNLNDEEFTNRYKGVPRESMEELLTGHDAQLAQFEKGSSKFLSPSFFNNWLRRYGSSPESRANALDEMSQFRSLDSWSQEASKQADGMGKWVEEWNNGSTKKIRQYQRFSIYDIYALVKQAVEVNRRRWERNSERAVAEIGVSFFGKTSPWGKEFHRKAQEAEDVRVKELQTEMDEDPWWGIQETLYITNDADVAKACINLLIEKGVFKWDDPKLWKTFMRLSNNAVNFQDKDKYLDFSEILEKCKNVIEFIWTRETFRQWDTTLESKIKSKEDEFADDFQRLEHHKTARAGFLADVLTRWSKGNRENTDPAKYGCFLRKAFEAGKLNGGPYNDSRWYFLIQGIKMGILSRDFFGRLNGELLGQMPFFDFFIDKDEYKKDGRIVPEGTPGAEARAWTYDDYEKWADMLHKDGEPYSVETARKRTKDFFYEVICQSATGLARVERKVREGAKNFDHDDGSLFSAALGVESVKKMLNTTSTDEDKYTPDFWRSVLAGYMPYFHGIKKFITENDEKYGRENAGWNKLRERNLGEVAERMKAMLLVQHSLAGNINLTERKSILFQKHDMELKGPMSPCFLGSVESNDKMIKNILTVAGKKEKYGVILEQGEWLSSRGEIAIGKEENTSKAFYNKDNSNKDTITGKLFDLIKGPAEKEIFTNQNVEKMLLDNSLNWEEMMGDFKAAVYETGLSVTPKKINISANTNVSSQEEEGDVLGELGMTG